MKCAGHAAFKMQEMRPRNGAVNWARNLINHLSADLIFSNLCRSSPYLPPHAFRSHRQQFALVSGVARGSLRRVICYSQRRCLSAQGQEVSHSITRVGNEHFLLTPWELVSQNIQSCSTAMSRPPQKQSFVQSMQRMLAREYHVT